MSKSGPPTTASTAINKSAAPKRRDKHGFRGTPGPAQFSLASLPDDALLTELETAALIRLSTNTLTQWRRRSNRQLPWITIAGGRVRYRAGDVRQFLASGEPRRPRGRLPAPKADAAPAPTPPKHATPPRRRAARPRTSTAEGEMTAE